MKMKTPRFKDLVLVNTNHGMQRRPCKFIPHTNKMWAITQPVCQDPQGYNLTHAPTGLAAASGLATQTNVVSECRRLMQGIEPSQIDTKDVEEVIRVLKPNVGRSRSQGLVEADLPVEEQKVEVEVTNVQTNETRLYTVSPDDLINGHHCTGPCECHMEPDAVCENGWPGTCDALARC